MSDSAIKLYDYFRSSAAFRVRIALNLKKLEYQVIPIHLIDNGGEQHSPAYRAINPNELVPTAIFDDRIITQSIAIIEYLEERYPNPPLLPNDHYHRALARSFALSIATDIHPLNNLRVLTYLKNNFKVSEEQKMQWYHHWVRKGLIALETQLQTYHVHGDFCIGDQPTMADICLIPQLYNAKRFQCDLADLPTLTRIDNHCQQLEAFQKALPKETVNS